MPASISSTSESIEAAQSPALIVADEGIIPYGDLYAGSQRVAALLYDAGLRPGDGVALILPNRPEFFEITWGCQLSGLYYSAVTQYLGFLKFGDEYKVMGLAAYGRPSLLDDVRKLIHRTPDGAFEGSSSRVSSGR